MNFVINVKSDAKRGHLSMSTKKIKKIKKTEGQETWMETTTSQRRT